MAVLYFWFCRRQSTRREIRPALRVEIANVAQAALPAVSPAASRLEFGSETHVVPPPTIRRLATCETADSQSALLPPGPAPVRIAPRISDKTVTTRRRLFLKISSVYHENLEPNAPMKRIIMFFLLGSVGTIAGLRAAEDSTRLLQKGLFEEEANHNYPAAIQAYQGVVQQFDQQRKMAATAVFRLAEIYRKQGNTNEAVARYERVLREFPDQSQLADLSRQQLTALHAAIPEEIVATTGISKEEAQELARVQEMVRKSPDLINAVVGGTTPLLDAARAGQLAVVEYFSTTGPIRRFAGQAIKPRFT